MPDHGTELTTWACALTGIEPMTSCSPNNEPQGQGNILKYAYEILNFRAV